MPLRQGRGTASPDLDNDRRQWQVDNVRPLPLYSRKSAPGVHCRGGCVGHIVGLDAYGREKISYPHRGSMPGPSNPQRVGVPTELSRPPDLCSSLTAKEVKRRKKKKKKQRVSTLIYDGMGLLHVSVSVPTIRADHAFFRLIKLWKATSRKQEARQIKGNDQEIKVS